MEVSVYFVPYIDGNWEGWGPVDPLMDFGNPPADLNQVESNFRNMVPFMQDHVGGKVAFGVHTSTYCRDLFFREPMLALYRDLVASCGEIVLHPHEELVGTPPLVRAKEHMKAIVLQKLDELLAAGIQPTAFRMGLGAFDDCIPSILQNAGISVDLSAAPGTDNWYWYAYWRNTPYSAYYLCPVRYTDVDCEHPKTEVLEIPWGNDGLGDKFSKNFLYNEAATLEDNQRVWDAIVRRAETTSEPQFVYFLAHLTTMSDHESHKNNQKKCASFLRYAQSRGGKAVTPAEAKTKFDELRANVLDAETWSPG